MKITPKKISINKIFILLDICLSYKYLLVLILAQICHGQVGRSTDLCLKGMGRLTSLDVHVVI